MKGLLLEAQWEPRKDYVPSEFEKTTRKVITGSSVWRYPKMEVTTVEAPRPGPDDVVIRVKFCGVCGSDVHFYETDSDGYMLYPGLTRFPTILGHEFSGVVEEVGKNVKDLKPGTPVTCEEMIWCGHCIPCRNGYPNHCVNLEEIGFTINGAFADYIVIGAKYCWPVDALVERYGNLEKAMQAAAFCEPTSVAYNGLFVRSGGFKPGAYVVVFGAGPIGLAAIALSRAAGASRVVVFEVSEIRRKLAKALGADAVYDPVELNKQGTQPREVIAELTKGEGADMLVEAAGAMSKTIPEMEASLAINGKIVIIGRAAERAPMYLENLQVRRSQVFGAQGHSGHAIFPSVIRMMGAGLIDMTKAITSVRPLDEAVDAIKYLSEHRSEGKIMVKIS
ncbi:MAG: alcohol dehydrogenase [Calditrichaeota bacterium]|nr:MAG: alcohol dehydrogenase [Calditrichota bacterium]